MRRVAAATVTLPWAVSTLLGKNTLEITYKSTYPKDS